MLSGVETPGCFPARGVGRAAQGCSHRQQLPGMACLGPGAPSPLPYSPLRLVPGTFLPKAGDHWSYRIAQPAVSVLLHAPINPL